MKKKIFIGIAMSLFAVATVFNMNISEQNEAKDLLLKNIETMQASAGEMWCDQSNQTTCKITMGGATGYSTGFLRATTN